MINAIYKYIYCINFEHMLIWKIIISVTTSGMVLVDTHIT
jgi:hypothetical protein